MADTIFFSGMNEKTAPIGADKLMIADTEGANETKYTDIGNLPISTATQTALNTKVDKTTTVNGKSLSSNITLTQDDVGDGTTYKRYSQTEKTKLAGIEAGAEVNVTEQVNAGTNVTVVRSGKDVTISSLGGGGGSGNEGSFKSELQTATAGQTVFNLTFDYVLGGNLVVFVNGALQTRTSSYNETDTNTITFLTGLDAGSEVFFYYPNKGLNWQGLYDNTTTYFPDDAVSYNGNSYICILESTGNIPTNTTYWDLLVTGAGGEWGLISGTLGDQTDLQNALDAKQDTLISGTNIQTINGNNLLQSGDLNISAGSGGYAGNVYFTDLTSETVGTYKQMSYTPDATETIQTAIANNNEVLLNAYIFDEDIESTTIPGGEWSFIFYGYVNNVGQTSKFRFEIFKRTSGGVETTLFSKESDDIDNVVKERISLFITQSQFTVNSTDKLGVRVYVNTTRTSDTTFSFIVGDGDGSFVTSPLRNRHNELRGRDKANSHPGTAIKLATVGTPTYSNVQEMQDLFHSAGWTSGGQITDAGLETINVAAGTGFIRAVDSEVSTILFFDWDESLGISIPTNTTRYIGIEYNAGAPQVVSRTTYNWNFNTDFPLGVVVNEGGTLHISNGKIEVGDHAGKMIRRLLSVNGIQRDEKAGGLIIGQTGTRNLTLSGGILWQGLTEFPISAQNPVTFDYYNGATVTATGVTQWDNLNYNNGGTTTVLTNNRYTNNWVYLETDGNVVILRGTAEYVSLSAAQNALPPGVVPNRITEGGRIIAQLTFQKGASTLSSIRSFFGVTSSSTAASDHNSLSNLQGGTTGEYYHLTASEYNNIVTTISTGTPVVATAGQTVFTTPTYTIGSNKLFVYVEGRKQELGTDYTETTTTSITFGTGLDAGVRVSYELFSK